MAYEIFPQDIKGLEDLDKFLPTKPFISVMPNFELEGIKVTIVFYTDVLNPKEIRDKISSGQIPHVDKFKEKPEKPKVPEIPETEPVPENPVS